MGHSRFDTPIALLLVEQDRGEGRRLCRMLADSDVHRFEVSDATSVEEALRMLHERSFDALLLDLGHPEGDELEPLMRARVAAADIPIVVIAADVREDHSVEALRAGAQEYLTRDECTPRLLGRTIFQSVERHRIRQELREARQREHFQATHDPMTGLANRESLLAALPPALAHAERQGTGLALLFIDLDHFKNINDSLGHAAGDRLLCFVAERIAMSARPGDLVARFAGDEFVMLLREAGGSASAVAHNLLGRLSEPYLLEGHETWVTASIGIAVSPTDGSNAEELLQNSDNAMYRAKQNGRNNCQFCTEAMNASASRRLLIRAGLTEALEQGRFSAEYQPVRDCRTGRVTAAEALIRWNDPEARDVPPDEFIPIAEDTGLIIPIGEWMLRTACEQATAWQDQGFRPIRMSVNVSGRQLRQHTLVATVGQILRESRLSPAFLELEITESTLVESDSYTHAALRELSRMGIGLAVDDFGTGYSALSYLRQFCFDRVKLDQSFVDEVATKEDARALAAAIVSMAKAMKLASVAEGVETPEQGAYLTSFGCEELQGHLVGQPMPAEQFVRFLEREKDDG